MSPTPAIDVVVVAYGACGGLRACVAPLAGAPGIRVTVVDNASPVDPVPALDGLDVALVRAARNAGFGAGCNRGAAEGTAPLLLFLNPDARIELEDLRRLAAGLEGDAGAAAAGPRTVAADGRLLLTQRRFPRPGSTLAQALFLHRLAPRADELVHDRRAYLLAAHPDWVSGACLLVRRAAFAQVGGFDEGFFLYREDADLCRRLRDAGWRVRYEPAALASHDEGSSAPRSALMAVHAASRIRYARKHLSPAAAAADRAAVALGAATHALAHAARPRTAAGHGRALRAALQGRAA